MYCGIGGVDIGAFGIGCFIPPICGDANDDGYITIADAVYLVRYLFKGFDPPLCPPPYTSCADTNGDGGISVEDIVYLINYLFKFGPEPICS